MRKIATISLLALALTGTMSVSVFADSDSEKHIIGVPVYNIADEQVQGFREYLENYIGVSFEDVKFLYSQSISSKEEEMAFLQSCVDAGAEGIMAFNSYDLAEEIAFCEENQIYYVRPAGTPSQEDFDKVADNPYYLGYFGPGEEMEYQSGYEMGTWFAGQDYEHDYFIMSGGAALGNVMHLERTRGILDAFQEVYGVEFEQSTEELAAAAEPMTVTAGDVKVTVCSGYTDLEPFHGTAVEAYAAVNSPVVLSVIPIGTMAAEVGDAKLGAIDCYTSQNARLYSEGKMQYLSGKYNSIIGPAFAAMYNALTGYADDFRDHGKAFSITQGFWTSDSKEDFEEKFALSSGIALNAYSVTDLLNVMKVYNEEASFEDLKALGEKWDFESAKERTAK